MERGTVEFRNNILTLPYQEDERGEEQARESTKGPTLLRAARRGWQPSKDLPRRASQKATVGLGLTERDKFLHRKSGSWRSEPEREAQTPTSHPSSRGILLRHRSWLGSDFRTTGCPCVPRGGTGRGRALQSLQARPGSPAGWVAMSQCSCPVTVTKGLHSTASSHCPAPRHRWAGPSRRIWRLPPKRPSFVESTCSSSQTNTRFNIRGKRVYYPIDFS